jgi:ABC-2 type transport system permease protein
VSLFKPGSTAWLLGYELKLAFRQNTRRKSRGIVLGLLMLFMAVPGYFVALALQKNHFVPVLTPDIVGGVDLGLAVLLTLMLSQTLGATAHRFYERGDLDLLLSSPLPPGRVLTVRCLGIALTPFLVFAGFLLPFLSPVALLVFPAWFAAFGLLFAMSLVASALGLIIALALFALIGPRRTRTVAQLLAAVIGAGFFLVSQLGRFAGSSRFAGIWAKWRELIAAGYFEPNGPLSWPVRAAMGEVIPAITVIGGAIVLFWLVVSNLGKRFAADAAAAAGSGGSRRRKPDTSKLRGFTGNAFQAMVDKETKLLLRDPVLLSQVLLRVLYLLPAAFGLWKVAGQHGGLFALAPGAAFIVIAAGQTAGSLAWITISAEDAPELLICSPAKRSTLRRAKLVAALRPVAVLLILPLLGLTYFSPWAGLVAALGCVAASISSGLICLWYERPFKRTDFRRQRGSGSWTAGIGAFVIQICWAGAIWLALSEVEWAPWLRWTALAPVALALVILGLLRKPDALPAPMKA